MNRNNIVKKCNLDLEDSISTYMNWGAQQNHNAFEVFHNFILNTKPKRILEIGTALGGLTCFMKYTCDKLNIDCEILTYDIVDKPWYNEIINMGINVKVENIFDDNYTKINEDVIKFIQKEGITIVLCDGGDKIKEFNLISKFIKKNDFILAHDYAENENVFEEKIYKRIWNWLEIQYSDIEICVNENNLEQYDKETFENIAWTCWKKKNI